MLDIGAGSGAITGPLARAGARVIAVELHPRRASELRARFAGANVRVVRADAAAFRLPRQPFLVVSNPPFAATTALLRRLLAPESQLVRAELIVPRHVAARWAGGRGPDARRWSATFDVTGAGRVPRTAFIPPPPADAAVLSIVRRRTRPQNRRSCIP